MKSINKISQQLIKYILLLKKPRLGALLVVESIFRKIEPKI